MIETYAQWRDKKEYIVLKGTKYCADPSEQRFNQTDRYGDSNIQHVAIKMAKRGNEIYRNRLRGRLSPFIDAQSGGMDKRRDKKTRALFLTLTWDSKKYTITESWDRISKDLNNFLAKMRQQYGKISYFRIYESSNKGYPHVHLVIYFKDKVWRCFEHNGKTRVGGGKKIGEFWDHFVDVKGVRSVSGSLGYLTKYLTKEINTDKGVFTQAIQWVFHKQSYAISGDFQDLLSDLIQGLNNSNNDFLEDQLNMGETIVFEVVGVVPAVVLRIDRNTIGLDPPQVDLVEDYLSMYDGSDRDQGESFP